MKDYINNYLKPTNLKTILSRALERDFKVGTAEATESDYRKVPTTDLAIARYVSGIFKEDIVYIPSSASRGDFFIWDGTVWVKETNGLVASLLVDAYSDALGALVSNAHAVIPAETLDDKESPLGKLVKAVAKTAHELQNDKTASGARRRLTNMFQKPMTHFDQDQAWIVFEDGQVLDTSDLRAGLLPPDPARAVNRKMAVTLGNGRPEKFLKSLEDRGIPADQQRYLQVAAGAALLGRGDAKNIVTLVGASGTGKSTYVETLLGVFGSYGAKLPASAIVAKTSTNFDQHRARGARFLYLEEPIEARTDDSFLKDLAGGGGLVSTQQKGRDVVDWKPQCVLHIAANHIPKINTQDDAIVKRMNIVPFDRQFEVNDGVFQKNIHAWLVEKEGPQIARWIVEGAAEYERLGFIPVAQSMKDNAARNVADASVAVTWLMEQFEDGRLVDCRESTQALPHSKMTASTKELYNKFTQWCFDEGYTGKAVPPKRRWQSDINYYMGEPKMMQGKRTGGFARLWSVANIEDVSNLRDVVKTNVS